MSITEHKVELLHPDPKDKIKWSHKLLPNPIKGFRMLIVAPSNTGKSVLTSFMFASPKTGNLGFSAERRKLGAWPLRPACTNRATSSGHRSDGIKDEATGGEVEGTERQRVEGTSTESKIREA